MPSFKVQINSRSQPALSIIRPVRIWKLNLYRMISVFETSLKQVQLENLEKYLTVKNGHFSYILSQKIRHYIKYLDNTFFLPFIDLAARRGLAAIKRYKLGDRPLEI